MSEDNIEWYIGHLKDAIASRDTEIAALKFQLTEALEWKQRWKEAAETAKDLYLAVKEATKK